MAAKTTIQLRRGTASSWTSTNPTLAQGEFGIETDTLKAKIGDGSTAWTSLAYAIGGNTGIGNLSGGTSAAIKEKINVVASAATGTLNIDLDTSAVWYYTVAATGNTTLNFRAVSGTALNSRLSTGETVTAVVMLTNGTTAYYPTAFQVDGSAVTPKWQLGLAPTGGDASAINSYTFTILKTADAAFTVVASQTMFV
jgi:hypothetical protein